MLSRSGSCSSLLLVGSSRSLSLLLSFLVAERLFVLLMLLVLRRRNLVDILQIEGHVGASFLFFGVFLGDALHLFDSLAHCIQRLLLLSSHLLALMEALLLIVGLIIIVIFIKLRLILFLTVLIALIDQLVLRRFQLFAIRSLVVLLRA